MCVSYSGRCLMSAFMAARSANAGACAHSCRWKYKGTLIMEEEKRPGEYYELHEDERGSYILNSKDLCLMPVFDKILSAGFDSFKIEGRNKSEYYVAQTARIYRKAIDDYFKNPEGWKSDLYIGELATLQNRGYTLGFFNGIPDDSAQDYEDIASRGDWRCAGAVRSYENGQIEIDIKHKLKTGDEIEILTPLQFEPVKVVIDKLYDCKSKKEVPEVNPGVPGQFAKILVPKGDYPEHTQIRIKIK